MNMSYQKAKLVWELEQLKMKIHFLEFDIACYRTGSPEPYQRLADYKKEKARIENILGLNRITLSRK